MSRFDELHRNIRACDDILSSVETNLTSFRNDLATVSADIETLQARSTGLNVRLENRKAVEKGLIRAKQAVSTYDASLLTPDGLIVRHQRFSASAPVADIDADKVAPAISKAANQVAGQVADWIGKP